MTSFYLNIILLSVLFSSCIATRKSFDPERKYAPTTLKEDFRIFRGALEESHPGLYWFTPRDSMNTYFDEEYNLLSDSLTERQFRTRLIRLVTKIKCGHTSVNYSRKYSRYLDTAELPIFPLAFKVWPDTLAITANLDRKDSTLVRGTVVTAINGYPAKYLIDTFLNFVTSDGNSLTGKYQSLSSYGTFGVMYKNVFGFTDRFNIEYIDQSGFPAQKTVSLYRPLPDSLDKTDSLKPEKYTPKERRSISTFSTRNIQVDTSLKSAYMSLNTFARGNRLRNFYRYAFKNIDRLKLEHLVIDVRSNGGGEAGNAIELTRYLKNEPFVIADSLYAIKRSSRYRSYIRLQPLYWLVTTIITKKKSDGNFHFGYFERHQFRPKKKHHYKGNIYILTGGNSFSATTLFAQELKDQPNVLIIGEETGGGAYGNNAWIIPELTLPNSGLRISIPKFRFVMRRELVKEGRGVLPDLPVAPTVDDIRRGKDVKLEAVREIIIRSAIH